MMINTWLRMNNKGFTLAEIMVVMLIIAVLVATAVPIYISTKANAKEKTCYANQRIIEGAAQLWLMAVLGRNMADVTMTDIEPR